MKNEAETKGAGEPAPRKKRIFRKRVLPLVGVAALVGVFLLLRFAVRVWMQGRLPADAPRIAFSLDNTLLAETGITDTTYEQAMIRAGGYLVNMRPDMAGSPQVDARVVERLLDEREIDGVFLTGGGDVDPALSGGETNDTLLVHRLRDDEKLMKTHLTLSGHPVDLVPDSKLAGIFGTTHFDTVISLHGQAVDRPGDGVRIVGRGGDGVAEAVEVRPGGLDAWIIGIQWHPELAFTDDVQNAFFNEFIEQAQEVRKRRIARRWGNNIGYLE